MRLKSKPQATLHLADFGTIHLALPQTCGDAVAGWDAEREALALINLSAIERATGLLASRDSALDAAEWLRCGVGLEVSFLTRQSIERRRLETMLWPWLGFAAEPDDAAQRKGFELAWPAIRVLWITAEGLAGLLG